MLVLLSLPQWGGKRKSPSTYVPENKVSVILTLNRYVVLKVHLVLTLLLGILDVLKRHFLGKSKHHLIFCLIFFFLAIFPQNSHTLISNMASKCSTPLQFHLVMLLIERCNSTEEGAPHEQAVNRTSISKYLMPLRNSQLTTFGFNFLTIHSSHALTINTELEIAGYLL